VRKTIITVVGKDKVGIIARICVYLSERNINVLNISQSIVDGYFNMMMITDTADSAVTILQAAEELEQMGNEMGLSIRVMNEDIFSSMHRI